MASRRRVTILVALLLVGAVGVAASTVPPIRVRLLRAAGWMLVGQDPVEAADAIVVPEWAGPAGALTAVDLVRQGVSTHVVVVAGPTARIERELARRNIPYDDNAARLLRIMTASGVAAERMPVAVDGTEAEGRILPSWCDAHGLLTVVVVSSSDHSRRVRRVLRREFAGHRARALVVVAPLSMFNPDSWWKSRDGTRTEIVEAEKLVLDVVRHPVS